LARLPLPPRRLPLSLAPLEVAFGEATALPAALPETLISSSHDGLAS